MTNGNLQLVRRLLRVESVVGEDTVQSTILSDVRFPVRITKVWQTDAKVREFTATAIPDKVIVEGSVEKQIYFVAAETRTVDGIPFVAGEVFEQTVTERFTQFVDIPGTTPGMLVQVHPRIEFVTHDLVRTDPYTLGQVWRQTVVLEIFVKVAESVQLEIIIDVIPPSGVILNVVKDLLKVESVVGENENQIIIQTDITFPRPAKKVKEIIRRIRDLTWKIIPDKVIIEGVLHKQILFVEVNTGRVFETSVDEKFTAFVEVKGARPGMVAHVIPIIEDVTIDLRNGTETTGFTLGRQTAVLGFFVKVTEEVQLQVVVDVIGPVDVVKQLLKVESVVGENEKQVSIRSDIFLPRPARKIVDVKSTVEINRRDTKVIPDKVIIEGILRKQIFYVDLCTDAVFEHGVTEKFTAFADVKGAAPGMNVQIHPRVEFVDHVLPVFPADICTIFNQGGFNPQNFPTRQTAVIGLFVKVTETLQLDVVTDVVLRVLPTPTPTPTPTPSPTPTPECPPGTIITVFIQPGDTLFLLGRKFGVSVNDILAANPGINPQNLQIGQPVRIPCPSVVSPQG
ncbi:MAG: DUF3794 and LysM peptidoglycan-binding domain-containing protein [Bacillota bacterium]